MEIHGSKTQNGVCARGHDEEIINMWLKPGREEISGGKGIREGTQFKSLEEEEGRVPSVNDCSASGLIWAPVIPCVQIPFHWT